MGYELHITRKPAWSDEVGPVITLDEWDKLAAGDADLLSTNFSGCFYADASGNIVAKNPEKPVRVKMYRMAQLLGAPITGRNLLFLTLIIIVAILVLWHLR